MLEPIHILRELEKNQQYFERLAMLEELKSKPWGAVWDYYCLKSDVPAGEDYIPVIQQYEKEVLLKR
ncbi:MAG: L-rhamnose isomerase [Bacteroidales bacterium]